MSRDAKTDYWPDANWSEIGPQLAHALMDLDELQAFCRLNSKQVEPDDVVLIAGLALDLLPEIEEL